MWDETVSRIHRAIVAMNTKNPGAARSFALNPDLAIEIARSLPSSPTGDPRQVLTLFGIPISHDEKLPRNTVRIVGDHGAILGEVQLPEEVAATVDYRELLKRYIDHVAHNEGTCFISPLSNDREKLLPGDMEILRTLVEELPD